MATAMTDDWIEVALREAEVDHYLTMLEQYDRMVRFWSDVMSGEDDDRYNEINGEEGDLE